MRHQIAISRGARADFDAAAKWYAAEDRLLAGRLREAVNRRLNTLADFPESCVLVTAIHRRAHLFGFPYSLYYRAEADRIFVVAVIHHRRGSEFVRDRLTPS